MSYAEYESDRYVFKVGAIKFIRNGTWYALFKARKRQKRLTAFERIKEDGLYYHPEKAQDRLDDLADECGWRFCGDASRPPMLDYSTNQKGEYFNDN